MTPKDLTAEQPLRFADIRARSEADELRRVLALVRQSVSMKAINAVYDEAFRQACPLKK